MDKREYLSQLYFLEERKRKLELCAEEYRRRAGDLQSVSYDKVSFSKQRSRSAPFEKWIEKAYDLELQIKELQAKIDALSITMAMLFETLNDDYRTVLTMRYLQHRQWDEIAEALFISRRTALNWHKKALDGITVPA